MNNVNHKTVLIASILIAFVSVFGALTLFGGGAVITGLATGTTTVTVTTDTTISLPVSTVAFGNLAVAGNNSTIGSTPPPFQIQNDGNVNVNVTVNASDLWANAGNPTGNYMINSTENEASSTENASVDTIAWFNVPNSSNTTVDIVTEMAFQAANDLIDVHINVTVPAEEASGAKTSTLTFTASAA